MSIRSNIGMKLVGKEIDTIIGQTVAAKVQELIDDGDITTVRRGSAQGYRSNEYNTYGDAVTAINEKYNGLAPWGVVFTGNIIDVRAAFTVPSGLTVVKTTEEDTPEEEAFTKEFIEYNGLDDEMPFEFAKEEEIEGKLCLQLFEDKDHMWRVEKKKKKGMIKIRFLPWTSTKYKVITKGDYLNFDKLVYEDPSTKKPVSIDKPDFTYRRFGGRIDRPNEPAMKIWKCLSKIDDLDKALRDWREIDRLFASPTPHFKCETGQQVKELNGFLTRTNWRIKKALATVADFTMVGPDMAGIAAIENEIVSLAKIISGTTGVPVHFLGLPDLLSNRATASNLMELVWATTVKEREIWNSAYTEVLSKAIDKYNNAPDNQGFKQLRNDVLRIEVQEVSPETWLHLEKVYMPMLLAGKLSLEYVLSQIPNLNIQEELERHKKMEEDELKKTKDELNKVILEKDNDPEGDGGVNKNDISKGGDDGNN